MLSIRTRLLYLEAVGWSQRCHWDSLTFSRRSKSLQAPYQSVLDRGVVKCTGYMVTGGKNIRLMIFWSFTLGATGCRWQTAQTCGVATPQGSVTEEEQLFLCAGPNNRIDPYIRSRDMQSMGARRKTTEEGRTPHADGPVPK